MTIQISSCIVLKNYEEYSQSKYPSITSESTPLLIPLTPFSKGGNREISKEGDREICKGRDGEVCKREDEGVCGGGDGGRVAK